MPTWFAFLFGDDPEPEPVKPVPVTEVDCRKCFAIVTDRHCETCGWFFCKTCRLTLDPRGRWFPR